MSTSRGFHFVQKLSYHLDVSLSFASFVAVSFFLFYLIQEKIFEINISVKFPLIKKKNPKMSTFRGFHFVQTVFYWLNFKLVSIKTHGILLKQMFASWNMIFILNRVFMKILKYQTCVCNFHRSCFFINESSDTFSL